MDERKIRSRLSLIEKDIDEKLDKLEKDAITASDAIVYLVEFRRAVMNVMEENNLDETTKLGRRSIFMTYALTETMRKILDIENDILCEKTHLNRDKIREKQIQVEAVEWFPDDTGGEKIDWKKVD